MQLPKELQKEDDDLCVFVFYNWVSFFISLSQSNTVTYGALLEDGVDRNSEGGSILVSQARKHLARLETLDGLLTEISSKLKERVESARQLVNRVVSVCGVASLPSDILILIFSFAVDSSSRKIPRSIHSVRLSHVCRHFRHIITTTPLFWTEISTIPRASKTVFSGVETALWMYT